MIRTSRWTRLPVVLAVATAVGIPAFTNAQGPSPLAFGVLAGATIPVGDFSNGSATGWHAGALLEWSSPLIPVGVRADIVYHQLGSKDIVVGASTQTSQPKMVAGTLNAVWTFPLNEGASSIRPYLTGGIGVYHVSFDATCSGACLGFSTATDSETKFGLNAGGGAKFDLSGFSTLIEARFHTIRTSCGSAGGTCNSNMVPISVGIVFR